MKDFYRKVLGPFGKIVKTGSVVHSGFEFTDSEASAAAGGKSYIFKLIRWRTAPSSAYAPSVIEHNIENILDNYIPTKQNMFPMKQIDNGHKDENSFQTYDTFREGEIVQRDIPKTGTVSANVELEQLSVGNEDFRLNIDSQTTWRNSTNGTFYRSDITGTKKLDLKKYFNQVFGTIFTYLRRDSISKRLTSGYEVLPLETMKTIRDADTMDHDYVKNEVVSVDGIPVRIQNPDEFKTLAESSDARNSLYDIILNPPTSESKTFLINHVSGEGDKFSVPQASSLPDDTSRVYQAECNVYDSSNNIYAKTFGNLYYSDDDGCWRINVRRTSDDAVLQVMISEDFIGSEITNFNDTFVAYENDSYRKYQPQTPSFPSSRIPKPVYYTDFDHISITWYDTTANKYIISRTEDYGEYMYPDWVETWDFDGDGDKDYAHISCNNNGMYQEVKSGSTYSIVSDEYKLLADVYGTVGDSPYDHSVCFYVAKGQDPVNWGMSYYWYKGTAYWNTTSNKTSDCYIRVYGWDIDVYFPEDHPDAHAMFFDDTQYMGMSGGYMYHYEAIVPVNLEPPVEVVSYQSIVNKLNAIATAMNKHWQGDNLIDGV